MRWMIEGKQLEEYLQACREGDFSSHSFRNMFNTIEQYKEVMDRIVGLVGSLDNLRIIEIGGGYGGQCKIIMDNYKVSCYHIIDLPEVCELQRKNCLAECFTEPTGEQYDLVISNYAISEIPDNKLYIDEVLKKSKRGYITCNTDFVRLDFIHSRLPDIPRERKTNYVLVW